MMATKCTWQLSLIWLLIGIVHETKALPWQLPFLTSHQVPGSKLDGIEAQTSKFIPKKIAIIGSGITGATAAFELSEGFRFLLPPDQQPRITVFERNAVIGGRITQAYAFNDPKYPIDTCAATFNQILDQCVASAAQNVGLRLQIADRPQSGTGVWDGKQFRGFVEADGLRGPQRWSFFRKSKWLERYGNDPFEFNTKILRARNAFTRFLGPSLGAVPGRSFQNAQPDLTEAINITTLLPYVRNQLCDDAIQLFPNASSLFAEEVIDATSRERYFEYLGGLNPLEVLFSYEEAMQVNVAGGNLRLIERLFRLSGAEIRLDAEVCDIEVPAGAPDQRTKIGVRYSFKGSCRYATTHDDFDSVIIATPFSLSNITLNLKPPSTFGVPDVLDQAYDDSFVTHFTTTSSLNATFFNRTEPGMPQNIYTITESGVPGDSAPPFLSLELQSNGVNNGQPSSPSPQTPLYRIVSRQRLTEADIEMFLSRYGVPKDKPLISWMHQEVLPQSVPTFDWNIGRDTCKLPQGKFEILPGVLYAGGQAQVLASVETGCRFGRNAANLILKEVANG